MALSAMPVLRELELHGVDYMSSAPARELAAASQPAFASLTMLAMSYDSWSHSAIDALQLWLQWALPAATQLRKLSVSGYVCADSAEGAFPFCDLSSCGPDLQRLCTCALACVLRANDCQLSQSCVTPWQ